MTGQIEHRRRVGTRRAILDAAVEVMIERGVAGLSLSEVARRVGVRQPSLYKHFPSLHAVYDELFREGVEQLRDEVARAVALAAPGLAALAAAVEAIGRHAMANQVVGQLYTWRPVPEFEPSVAAMRPSIEMVAIIREALHDAVVSGELGAAADSDEGAALMSIVITGVLTQQMANEPGATYERGQFSSLLPRAFDMFVQYFAPKTKE